MRHSVWLVEPDYQVIAPKGPLLSGKPHQPVTSVISMNHNSDAIDFPPNPIDKLGYCLEFSDSFRAGTLDANKWLPFYLPQWSSWHLAAARYSLERVFGYISRKTSCLGAQSMTALFVSYPCRRAVIQAPLIVRSVNIGSIRVHCHRVATHHQVLRATLRLLRDTAQSCPEPGLYSRALDGRLRGDPRAIR
jgi:hypothetical protein